MKDCLKAYHPDNDTQASRELRLLRAYLFLDSTAHYGARRFATYSDAPADDANQLMGAIASSVEGLTLLENERTEPAGDSGSLFRSRVLYKVDKVDVFLRIVTTVDAATKPVVRGVTGMLFLIAPWTASSMARSSFEIWGWTNSMHPLTGMEWSSSDIFKWIMSHTIQRELKFSPV